STDTMIAPFLYSGFLIEIDQDPVRDRKTLTAQYKATRHLVVFQGEVGVHIDLSFHHLAPTGGTYATFARIGKFHAMGQGGVEQAVLVFLDGDAARHAVQHNGQFAMFARRLADLVARTE